MRLVLCAAALCLAGCGYIGNPQAPTLDMPQKINDLQVVEYGDQLLMDFTIPLLTSEGLPLKSLRSIDLRIGVGPEPWDEKKWMAAAKQLPLGVTPGHIETKTPAAEWIGKEVIVRVRATGPKGKTSDWSPMLTFHVEPPLAPPTDLTVVHHPGGLYIGWKYNERPSVKYRVYLKVGDDPPYLKETATGTGSNLLPPIEFGKTYQYFIQAIDGELHQSETVASKPIVPEDTFAPTTPAGLTATQGASTIELSWERNTDPRFQGYNVYRSVNDGPAEKIASLIIAPAYSDSKIEAGKKYRYTVTGVGTNGIESEKSAPYDITAQ